MANKSQAQNNTVSNHETLREGVKEVGKSLTQGWGADTLAQLLGIDTSSSSKTTKEHAPANLNKGVIFDAAHHKKSKADMIKAKYGENMGAKPERRAAGIDYHREVVKSSEKSSHVENRELNEKIQQITIELKRLINSSSKVLQMEFAEVSVSQSPVEAGKYHVNFLEWMLLVIKNAREKVEDSGAWLNAVKGKGKGGKKDSSYWGMFKKHGTSFGLSNERSVATQTG